MTSTPVQADLFEPDAPRSAHEVRQFLNEGARQPVDVVFTRNRVSMVSVSFDRDGWTRVRLNEGFRRAPDDVLTALRRYLRTRRREAWTTVADYAGTIPASSAHPPRRVLTRGRVYDLAEIRDTVNRRHFNGRLKSRVGWGPRRAARGRRPRSIRFGVYYRHEDLVLINPRLDRADVPSEFVEYIVFHEMLHAVVPVIRRNGRWAHHSNEFQALERQFPNWLRMQTLAAQLDI